MKERKLRVYSDMKSDYIMIRKPKNWSAGTRFVVNDCEAQITLVKIEDGSNEIERV